MITDYLKFALSTFSQRRLRSWLTILGIFIGIAAVVALISLSAGMQSAITKEFENVGSDRIIVSPGGGSLGPMGSELAATKLSIDDVDAIEGVQGTEVVAGVLSKTKQVTFEEKSKTTAIFGTPTEPTARKYIETMSFFEIEKGRQLKDSDTYSAIIGNNVAYDYFEKDIKTGDHITISNTVFEVVGIQKSASSPMHNAMVRIPLDTARDLFDEPTEVSSIFVKVQKGFEPTDVAADIEKKLRKEHDVDKGEEDFSVQTAEQLIATFKAILLVVQAVFIGIAAISLVVGGIGIMNTMYTSVLERTREIGIMKAVGAKNSDVLLIFLIESGMIGLVGGIVGVAIGIGISKTAELITVSMGITALQASLSPVLIFGALAFSFVIGALSGAAPAFQAAKMKPVDALRYKK